MTAIDSYQSRTAGRWTKEQHEKFLYGLKIYGKNWKKIQDLIQTRTSTQIRSHAQKFFIKMKKSQKYDEQSDNLENSSQSKFAQQTIVCKDQLSQVEKEKTQFSFYFQKIVKNYVIHRQTGKQFNFWDILIDCQKVEKYQSCEQLNIPNEFQVELKRQNSNFQKGYWQENMDDRLLRTQFCCFEEFQK